MARVVVVSGDILPFPGYPTTGAGLRAWGLANGLESRGHEVIKGMPHSVLKATTNNLDDAGSRIADEVGVFLYQPQGLTRAILAQKPDIVVVQHWRLASLLPENLEIPLVIDFHGPLLLEVLFQDNPTLNHLKHEKIQALHKADFFTCAGEKQRLYFEAWLLMAGVDVRDNVIQSIPVSLSPEMPEHASQGECTFVYGGLFLPWQDPVLGLNTLIACLEQRQTGILKFFGGKHPVVSMPTKGFETLQESLRQSPNVQVQSMIPRDELIRIYGQSHVAIDLMQRNAERELAFTTRTVEYLWCGLPVIYNDYAELAEYIIHYQAGWCINPADSNAIRSVIEQILDNPNDVAERSRNAQRLVKDHLTWDRSIEPLDQFCQNPHKRVKSRLSFATSRPSGLSLFYNKMQFYFRNEGIRGLLRRMWSKMR